MPPASPDAGARRTCLVTGATGALGPAVIAALLREGHTVRALVRQPPPPDLLPAAVELHRGDVTDEGAVGNAMMRVDWVFHLAARLHVVNPPPSMRAEYERVNVGGTRTVMQTAAGRGVRRVVFFSTIAVYGPSRGQLLTEDVPPRPDTMYGETKLEAEASVLATRDVDGRPIGTVLRLAAVYGPRVKGNYRRLLTALARRRFLPIGAGGNRRTLVFEEDAAGAAALAAANDAAAGRVFNVTDGQVYEVRAIVHAICAALGRRPPLLTIPAPVARAAALGVDLLRGGRSAARAALDKYLEDVAVDGSRLRDELGVWRPCDLQAGWQRTVQILRAQGQL